MKKIVMFAALLVALVFLTGCGKPSLPKGGGNAHANQLAEKLSK